VAKELDTNVLGAKEVLLIENNEGILWLYSNCSIHTDDLIKSLSCGDAHRRLVLSFI
jgi:hypothetical protein